MQVLEEHVMLYALQFDDVLNAVQGPRSRAQSRGPEVKLD